MADINSLHPLKEINGISLDDYVPCQRSYNTVVYIHKRFLKPKEKDKEQKPKKDVEKTLSKPKKSKKKEKKRATADKGQQFNGDVINNNLFRDPEIEINDSVLGQTIQFAKNIVPLLIPPSAQPSGDLTQAPVYYTIKATQKTRKKHRPHDNHDLHDATVKKSKETKKLIETYKNEKVDARESISVKETISYSSNTLDELHMNPSLCCSLSDLSEKKHHKRDRNRHKHNSQKVVASDSLEAIATELINTSGDPKIKIHLMNETDKNLLAENIRMPLVNAVRECISEINSQNDISSEIISVQKNIKSNTQKLDVIFDKLTCIEKKLDLHEKQINKIDYFAKESAKPSKSPRRQANASTLEQLGQDLLELKESDIEDGIEEKTVEERKKAKSKSTVVHLDPRRMNDQMEKTEKGALGCGENMAMSINPPTSHLGVKPERSNRIPARFCWTDATRKGLE